MQPRLCDISICCQPHSRPSQHSTGACCRPTLQADTYTSSHPTFSKCFIPVSHDPPSFPHFLSFSYIQAQQPPASQQSIAAETVQLRFCVRGLEPQLLPVRLRPGAPLGLRLLPGHPFLNQVGLLSELISRATKIPCDLCKRHILHTFYVRIRNFILWDCMVLGSGMVYERRSWQGQAFPISSKSLRVIYNHTH